VQPIGVFDSGMGGLTVLAALSERLPNESFVYLGDTARLPYGSKSAATVSRYAIQAAQHLHRAQVKLIVIACNTASAVALHDLRQAFAPTPVIGVVQPGAAAASKACESSPVSRGDGRRGVLVLATESTVRGGAYARAIHSQNATLPVYSRACPLLVALAEEGRVDDVVVDLILRDYLAGYLASDQMPQTLLLGCTHFPVFRRALQRLLPPGVAVVDSASTTAAAVAQHLEQTQQRAASPSKPSIRFLATDGIERFARVGRTFLGAPVADVQLVDL
jgi:glutamate racemase